MNEPTTLNDCLREFFRGATRPSLPAIVITLLVCMTSFLVLMFSIGPSSFAGESARVLMTGCLDTYAAVTGKSLAILTQRQPAPNVVILGTSTIVRTVTSEDDLAAQIGTASQPAVYDMCTDAQNSWEMAAIVDIVAPYHEGVLVVGISPGLLSRAAEDGFASLKSIIENPRLGFISPVLDHEARRAGLEIPFRTGIYALDNRAFLLARREAIRKNLLRGSPSYGDPMNAAWMVQVNKPEFWQEEIDNFPALVANYEINHAMNLDVIKRSVDQLRMKGNASAILMVAPINPRWNEVPGGQQFHQRYLAELDVFADENDMLLVNMTAEAELTASEFVDYEGHLGSRDAQRRCTAVLAERISELLREMALDR